MRQKEEVIDIQVEQVEETNDKKLPALWREKHTSLQLSHCCHTNLFLFLTSTAHILTWLTASSSQRTSTMIGLKASALNLALAAYLSASCADAFAPSQTFGVVSRTFSFSPRRPMSSAVEEEIDLRTGKPTGTSFLPEETLERAEKGNPTEKVKLTKDATSAWVDVYEYARKIRQGEMTWDEVEKADLDTVRTEEPQV